MENNFENRVIYHQAKAELMSKIKNMGLNAVCWFALFRLLTLWTEGGTNLELIGDSITAATALYLPYRLGFVLTGTSVGGASLAVVILLWMSTWIGHHELLGWIMIIGGYLIDFAPCIYKLIANREH